MSYSGTSKRLFSFSQSIEYHFIRHHINSSCVTVVYLFLKQFPNLKLSPVSGYLITRIDNDTALGVKHFWIEYMGIIIDPAYKVGIRLYPKEKQLNIKYSYKYDPNTMILLDEPRNIYLLDLNFDWICKGEYERFEKTFDKKTRKIIKKILKK